MPPPPVRKSVPSGGRSAGSRWVSAVGGSLEDEVFGSDSDTAGLLRAGPGATGLSTVRTGRRSGKRESGWRFVCTAPETTPPLTEGDKMIQDVIPARTQ